MRLLPLLALLLACQEPADSDTGCPNALDADGDGVCDHDIADWSRDAQIPDGGHRGNIFDLAPDDLAAAREAGLRHAAVWPVEVSGLLLPYEALTRFFADDGSDPAKAAMLRVARQTLGFGTMEEMYDWLGLPPFPTEPGEGPFHVPLAEGRAVGNRVGAGIVETEYGDALTFSCATCHSAQVFGRTVMGMTNRKARANEFFHLATLFFPGIESSLFASFTDATEGEIALFERTQRNLPAVGAKVPEVLGLDTALAQVGLSLARRKEDGWATRDPALEAAPPDHPLETFVADSKPAVWWSLKYKTRWLSDGSIVSGNPIFTNFLWNEVGRATDLTELDDWMERKARVVDELTVAVFAAEAPRWTDFFDASTIDLAAAKRGQAHFEAMCASCHGTYEKGWDAPDASTRSPEELLATTAVRYHRRTPVLDVGTDPQRHQGMAHFADDLNRLAISQRMETVVEVQEGYVPPPLEGVWLRYPYLHNQSVPTLCDLLSPAEARTPVFWIGTTDDPATDFDADCVGFPVSDAVPEAWTRDPRRRYDTSLPGLSNAGHDDWLLDSNGDEILSPDDKADLIAFLKTL